MTTNTVTILQKQIEEIVDKKLEDEIEVSSPLSDLIDNRVCEELQKHEEEINKMIEVQLELVLGGDWFVEGCVSHIEKLIAPLIEELVDQKIKEKGD